MPRLLPFASIALLGLVATSACLGNIGDPPKPNDPDPEPQVVCTGAVEPGPSPIRRMTRFEYNNTVRDLLGDLTSPADTFGAEEEALGFNNNAANLTVSDQLANKYLLAAEGVSERATDPAVMPQTLGCDPAAMGPDACAQQFIATFLTRAFRRPLTQEEKDAYFALYQKGLAEPEEPDPFRVGVQLVIQAALQSPAFLYRVEMGLPAEPGATYQKLSHHEMASRLSYFLWGTMPDPELFAAADAGQLGTKEEIEQQARRMIADPKARDALREFHTQWLDYDRIGNITKDAALFPDYSPAIGQMMREEMNAFIDHAVFEGEGDFASLLTAPYSYMPPELAAFYGFTPPEGAQPGQPVKVDFDPAERGGILTLGALMTINAHTNQTSPVHRGKLIREQFLCFLMPPPPPDIIIVAPEPGNGTTAKERFKQHSEDTACSGCHAMMDPPGFAFEHYDSIGRYRTMDEGKPIDATGTVIESDIGDFTNAVDLVNKMADSEDVQQCYVKQWFRFGYGRGESKADTCTVQSLQKAFVDQGGDIRELLVSLTQADAFLYRRAGGTP
jgi:Protein of unknown function (DUF1592)/Protein of unknown function (DUF1588)/Protein of unknown function (DUF1595)/Protein of unknown function (DUF1587)/Protein of unknown function (DUF1585)